MTGTATLDVTLTVAMPVGVARLGAHWDAYRETLPALDALRACNRFGRGPQCYINKLPVELIQRISDYHVTPIRQKKFEWWVTRLSCYEGYCTTVSHYTREEKLKIYYEKHAEAKEAKETEDDGSHEPDDKILNLIFWGDDTQLIHDENRDEWEAQIKKLLPETLPAFKKHFGLDVWLSKVCLGLDDEGLDYLNTTAAYLILPDRGQCTREWNLVSKVGLHSCPFETGLGMKIAPSQQVTPKVIQQFSRAMMALDLKPCGGYGHLQKKPLSLAPTDTEQAPASDKPSSASSFPRQMLLIRNKVEGE